MVSIGHKPALLFTGVRPEHGLSYTQVQPINQAQKSDDETADRPQPLPVPVAGSSPSPPTPLTRRMPQGQWDYDWARFPAAWFGNNVSGWENERQMQILGRYRLVMFGWQAMQGPTNYSHTLKAQVEQARRVKERYPRMPTVVYVPSDGVQPMYDADLPLFQDFQRFQDFFYLNASGSPLVRHKCAIGTHKSGSPDGQQAFGCEVWNWNFYNASAKDYYLEVVLKRVADMDPDNAAFDGIFLDAAMGFMRHGCPVAAANCPKGATKADRDRIGTEILARTVENMAKWGKYPIFNAHYGDMSFNGDTPHSEQQIMSAIGATGGMMRYYDGDGPLSIALIDNALQERAIQLPTVFHVKGKKQPTIKAIAIFMLIRANYSYFSESNGYYDAAFKWHEAYDLDYGLPTSEPTRTADNSTVLYSRTYGRCVVSVSCNVTACREAGADLIHNCCDANVRNTSTGRDVHYREQPWQGQSRG